MLKQNAYKIHVVHIALAFVARRILITVYKSLDSQLKSPY